VRRVFAVCGSRSGPTATQRRAAVAHGWAEFPLDESDRAVATSAPGVIVHSGPIGAVDVLGRRFAELIRTVVDRTDIRRIIVAGGDTSGRVVRELGIKALEIRAGIGVGAALCTAIAPGNPLDGIEFALKGGQVGTADFFETVRTGGRIPRRS